MKPSDSNFIVTLLRRLLNGMITHHEHLELDYESLSRSVTITIRAHGEDTSRLIGEEGSNYRAIVMIMNIAGIRKGVRVNVPPILEPKIGARKFTRFESRTQWPKEQILSLMQDTAMAVVAHPESVSTFGHDDSTSTTVEIFVSKQEDEKELKAIQSSFDIVFGAIGKVNGRLLYVDIVPNVDAEQPQPKSADGRFASEKKKL